MIYRFGGMCPLGDPDINNLSTAWTMVNSADALGWAQSGLLSGYGSPCWRHFAQQKRSGSYGPVTLVQYCVTTGESHQATEPRCRGNWRIRSNIDTCQWPS